MSILKILNWEEQESGFGRCPDSKEKAKKQLLWDIQTQPIVGLTNLKRRGKKDIITLDNKSFLGKIFIFFN